MGISVTRQRKIGATATSSVLLAVIANHLPDPTHNCGDFTAGPSHVAVGMMLAAAALAFTTAVLAARLAARPAFALLTAVAALAGLFMLFLTVIIANPCFAY